MPFLITPAAYRAALCALLRCTRCAWRLPRLRPHHLTCARYLPHSGASAHRTHTTHATRLPQQLGRWRRSACPPPTRAGQDIHGIPFTWRATLARRALPPAGTGHLPTNAHFSLRCACARATADVGCAHLWRHTTTTACHKVAGRPPIPPPPLHTLLHCHAPCSTCNQGMGGRHSRNAHHSTTLLPQGCLPLAWTCFLEGQTLWRRGRLDRLRVKRMERRSLIAPRYRHTAARAGVVHAPGHNFRQPRAACWLRCARTLPTNSISKRYIFALSVSLYFSAGWRAPLAEGGDAANRTAPTWHYLLLPTLHLRLSHLPFCAHCCLLHLTTPHPAFISILTFNLSSTH